MGVLWPADNVEQQHCWWRWWMSRVSCLLRLSQHFTQASLSSLWELWLNNNNQSIPSICDLQNTAFSLLWPPRLLDCRTARRGEVESSDGGLAHDGMHRSVMSKLPSGYLTFFWLLVGRTQWPANAWRSLASCESYRPQIPVSSQNLVSSFIERVLISLWSWRGTLTL